METGSNQEYPNLVAETFEVDAPIRWLGNDIAMLAVLSQNIGLPVHRDELLVGCGYSTDIPASEQVSGRKAISLFMSKVRSSTLAERILVNDTQNGAYHYLLLTENQDIEAAERLLTEAVTRMADLRKEYPALPVQTTQGEVRPWEAEDDSIANYFGASEADVAWDAHAACKGQDTDLFYPEGPGHSTKVQILCGRCTVANSCLLDEFDKLEAKTITINEILGIRGGLIQSERQRIFEKFLRHGVEDAKVWMELETLRTLGYQAARTMYRTRGIGWSDAADISRAVG